MAARGRPFLLWAQPERRIPLWLSTLEQPQPSGLVGWVSAQTCSWQRCMHMGEGPPPLTPWPGAGEGRRDGGSGLGWVPCRTRPPRLRTAGGNSPPRHAKRASVSPVPPNSTTGGQWRLGWHGEPLRGGRVGHSGGSLSSAQQQRILGKPGQGLAEQWGWALPVPCGGTWPRAGGQCSH